MTDLNYTFVPIADVPAPKVSKYTVLVRALEQHPGEAAVISVASPRTADGVRASMSGLAQRLTEPDRYRITTKYAEGKLYVWLEEVKNKPLAVVPKRKSVWTHYPIRKASCHVGLCEICQRPIGATDSYYNGGSVFAHYDCVADQERAA